MPLQIAVPVGVPFNALEFLDELIMSKDGGFRLSSPHDKKPAVIPGVMHSCVCDTPGRHALQGNVGIHHVRQRLSHFLVVLVVMRRRQSFSAHVVVAAVAAPVDLSNVTSEHQYIHRTCGPSSCFLPLRRGRLLNRFQKFSSIGAKQGGEKCDPKKGESGFAQGSQVALFLHEARLDNVNDRGRRRITMMDPVLFHKTVASVL